MKCLNADSPATGSIVSRRAAIAGALAGALIRPVAAAVAPKGSFVAGGQRGSTALLALFDTTTGVARELISLGGRAHSVAPVGRNGTVVAVARRSDRWAVVIDPADPQSAVTVRPAEGHAFSGHVAVSPDGVFAAFVEIRASDALGFLSLREAGGAWREVGRLETSGIGPHMALWIDDRHIAVANGGYYDVGRVASPDGHITASLAVIDRLSGRPAALVEAGASYADYSLRHIAAVPNGLAVVLQRLGTSLADTPPAALWHGGHLEPLPMAAADPLRGYCSDVAVAGDCILTTSRLAGMVGAWRRSDRVWLGAAYLADVGALAVNGNGNCFAAAEDGTLAGIVLDPGPAVGWRQRVAFGWDNHGAFL